MTPSSSSSKPSLGLRIFRNYMSTNTANNGALDVSGIISRECFLAWLAHRNVEETDREAQKFRRALINHASGTDGRCPFDADEEAAVLHVLRSTSPWPCFAESYPQFGKPYRSKGYHEKQRDLAEEASKANTHQLLQRLCCTEDADYLVNLATGFTTNLAIEGRHQAAAELLRYLLLGRTRRCCMGMERAPAAIAEARQLCDAFSSSSSHVNSASFTVVLDLCSTRPVVDFDGSDPRVLAATASCDVLFESDDNLDRAATAAANEQRPEDFFRLLLAVGGAILRPGVSFTMMNQPSVMLPRRRFRALGAKYDISYQLDPSTLLLVCSGRAVDAT